MNRIKLTGSQLRRIINESVKNILEQRRDFEIDGQLDPINYKDDDKFWNDVRSNYPEGKEGDNEYSWDLLNNNIPGRTHYKNDPSSVTPFTEYDDLGDFANKERLHTLDRTKDYYSDSVKGDHAYYQDGNIYPSAEFTDEVDFNPKFAKQYDDGAEWRWSDAARRDLELGQDQKSFQQQMKDFNDKLHYEKQADSRPLHRKGSLNRELDETIRRIVRKVLTEGRNDELFEWFIYLISNDAQQLYDFGSLENAKAAIENRIQHSTLTPKKKQEYLYGGYDFNGIMGAKNMDMLANILKEIGLAGTGDGLRGTGRRKRFF